MKKEAKKVETATKSTKVRKYKKVLAKGTVFVPGEGTVVDHVIVSVDGNATITYHKETK